MVQGADLINGLLTINLEKIIPEEKKPKTIKKHKKESQLSKTLFQGVHYAPQLS